MRIHKDFNYQDNFCNENSEELLLNPNILNYIQEGTKMKVESLLRCTNIYVRFYRIKNGKLVVIIKSFLALGEGYDVSEHTF